MMIMQNIINIDFTYDEGLYILVRVMSVNNRER